MNAALAHVDEVIARHRPELQLPGVLSLRAGYEFVGGWPAGSTPAIVVTVEEKTSAPPGGALLPSSVEGLPVDVRQASEHKREALAGALPAADGLPPDRWAPPVFADEVRPDGAALRLPAPEAVAAAVAKPQLPYTAPEGSSLDPVTAPVTVQACASPDAGWPVLRTFLGGVQQTLTIGLYDWTSQHVLDWFTEQLAGKTVHLVLDHPARNPTADQSDEETVTALTGALANDLTQAWALERADPLADAWIFPSAYHIKVAVADSARVWLSSGNWNNSNQPDIDPVAHPDGADAATARTSDRDWHVVLHSPELAATFETYLTHDLDVAAQHQTAPREGIAELAGLGAAPLPPTASAPHFVEFFGPTSVTDTMTVTPLLTPDPDIYATRVRALIAAATRTLYMQFQYIQLPTGSAVPSPAFTALIAAVVDRQQAGVDVRIVMSQYETQGYLEQLIEAGLDVANGVRIQANVHNKGIVVDGSAVLVSSQNWSNAGTTANRDAGVVIEHPAVARYFEQVFLHDWEHLARSRAAPD